MFQIDTIAVKCMTDRELAEYLPAKGDRLALRAFSSSQKPEGRKERLFETFKQKMMLRNRRVGEEEDDRERDFFAERNHLEGNKNAAKSSRKLELAWIHEGRQVRKKNGGGTWSVEFDKTATKLDILIQC